MRAGWTREREREREGSGFFFGRFVRPSTSRRRNPPPDPDLSSHVFLPLCILSRSPRTSNHSPSRLEDLGHGVGASLLELLCWRERGGKRTPTALDALKFAHSSLWRALFGRQAKDLEQSNTVSGSVSFSLFRFRFFLSFYREETEQAGEDGERGVDRKERERGRPRSEKKRGAEKGKKRKKARNSKQLGPKKLKKKQAEDEYMISDFDLPLLKFVSVPKDFHGLNCAAFAAGAVRGALAAAGFPARVTAHFVPVKGGDPRKPKTTILIKFDASVMAREAG